MTGNRVKFGLTLPNRGVVIGATTVAEMLQLATDAESAGWDSVWVGDSIFAKPRLDAMVLLGAIRRPHHAFAHRTGLLRQHPATHARDARAAALMRPWTEEIATQQAWEAALGKDGQRDAAAEA